MKYPQKPKSTESAVLVSYVPSMSLLSPKYKLDVDRSHAILMMMNGGSFQEAKKDPSVKMPEMVYH
ncbi:uncharacterized protein PADG_11579 [Paracoccidioides brasiliensis Pb18]|uniref:Uncharacterized protein n=1 Tax=Paracoccidioides brasiliensis (strain Pb18) TaxID=502780 RepID=A0A0A0HYD8_PARBD|nr:uncharacterized protein PADG_11579 [Paracoccidioides brasiliensis Pb18]KGM92380.1 hypothetical protein PADG_11579 [Paracoccidioides brasiliensis Pb18]